MIATGATITDTLEALVGGAEALAPTMLCSILLLDADGRLRHAAAPRLPAAYIAAVDGTAIGANVGSCGTAAFTGEPVHVTDIATDPRWEAYRSLALGHGLRACWSTPVFDPERRVLGTFAIYYREPGPPQPWHLQLIAMATHVAAVAIESDRARRALADSERGLRELSARLLRSQDDERRRIARDLHDTTGQSLAALALNLSLLQQRVSSPSVDTLLEECVALTNRSAYELRTLSYLLYPPSLETFGLRRAIEDFVEGFARRTGLVLTFTAGDAVPWPVGDTALALFRVVQESLTNVLRHSGSPSATVSLEHAGDRLILQIRDAGRGPSSGAPVIGVGIAGMRERLRELGGRLEVVFGDDGTCVRASLPVGEGSV